MSTLKQVALATGVHLTTVAAVLNGAGGNTRVGEATRKRVLRAAHRLGYVRNESARRLRTGTSNAVGWIGGDLRNPFFSELTSALERELEVRDFQLVVSHVSAGQGRTFAKAAEIFRQQTISKIIYWHESTSQRIPTAPPGVRRLPIGFTTQPRPGIWLDLGHAFRLALDCLLERGHRRLGFYAPRGQRESPSVSVRQKMLVQECRKRGLPTPACFTYDGESWDVAAAVKGAPRPSGKEPAPDAFLSFNDVAALGLLMASLSWKKKPLVVCFDGTALTRSWPGSRPVLDLKIAELARQAVTLMIDGKDDLASGRRENWLRPELIRSL
jgi:LacI family transcriptional regulator